MLFVGIDLAWSDRNGTGIAILKANKDKLEFVSSGIFNSDMEIIEQVRKCVGKEDAFIAVDAPLIVPNESGRRIAEKLTGSLFRKYDAGAHPSNRKRLSSWNGKIRGEELSRLLENEGFKHSPFLKRFEKSRKFFEVYPHPSMVVLFNLDKILQYKAKPKRDYKFRWKEFEKYQIYLKSLLALPEEIIGMDVRKLKAQALKDYEDKLDAVFCAYIAYYTWKYPEKCAILGSMKDGYILTPVFSHMKQQLESMKSQKMLNEF